MAINACTIDGFTLHGRNCRDKFATLIPILHPPVPVVATGGNPRVLRDSFVMPPQFEFEDRPTLNFEQPWVTVEVVFDGVTHTQQLDNGPQMHFVTVTGLQIDVPPASLNLGPPTNEEQDAVNITAEWI
jgi:hypothetical protein